MNVLVCNDDGIDSEGLIVLATCLSKEHNVLVVAPESNRSAFAHSLTIYEDIKFREVNASGDFTAYAISGTPVDCVKFATHVFPDFRIDLVCSGINKGPNVGTDVLYSGTVSAGLEANCLGLPAIAFSSVAHVGNKFDTCGIIAVKIIDKLKKNLSNKFTYNVNVPNLDLSDIKGVKATKLGIQVYTDRYVKTGDGTYRLEGEPTDHDLNDSDCDVEWIKKGYVTVTPVLLDKTDYTTLYSIGKDIDL
ncbi:MAG: 5'/3'-nucleotidase SurE [Clostridia bacterium]|nr:5'/3'-nucleotidase SurE [Clostridia bacterium]